MIVMMGSLVTGSLIGKNVIYMRLGRGKIKMKNNEKADKILDIIKDLEPECFRCFKDMLRKEIIDILEA